MIRAEATATRRPCKACKEERGRCSPCLLAEDWRKVVAVASALLATKKLDLESAASLEVVRAIGRRRLRLHDEMVALVAAGRGVM